MTNAAFAAEDVIETDLVERNTPFTFQAKNSTRVEETSRPLTAMGIRTRRKRKTAKKQSISAAETSRPRFSLDLDKAIQEIDFIILAAMLQVKLNNGEQDQLQSKGLASAVDSTSVPRPVKVVGLKEETNHLIDQLTSHQSNRHVIPIVGMGGLGKTTLATNVYNHPHLKGHFDVKAWVTISQVYTPRTIFSPLLRDIGVKGTDQIDDSELGLKLHKGLFGRRYLIIIDDIWDLKAWDEMIRFCPDNNNGSRILLTTRLLDVANRVSSCSPLNMQLLDDDKSWDLLSKLVFEQDVCAPEIKHCGKEIAKNCKGLPLAIVVIAGLLKVPDGKLAHWEHVEKNTRSIIGLGDKEHHCMKILCLSYHQLPIHLKPCFLYMATFSKDYKIKVSEVTKLWAADGFLKPTVDKTLDEVALKCLSDLVSRNLVIIKQQTKRGKMKFLIVHDLLRDLCIKEAQKEKFVYVDDGVVSLRNSIESQRRYVVHGNSYLSYRYMKQNRFSRSFIWLSTQHSPLEISGLSLLRVLISSDRGSFDEDNMQLFNLRFLMFSMVKAQLNLLSSISWALNLETLILRGFDDDCNLPVEIWKLWRLKHLLFVDGGYRNIILPDPPTGSDFVLENLQTLKGVRVLSDIVLDRIPNIIIMRIHYLHDGKMEPPCFDNFAHCHKLEKLHFEVQLIHTSLGTHKFPSYLRKVTLRNTRIQWENMTIVGSLPNLEYLSLGYQAFIGEEWKSVEGEFEKLTYLRIVLCNDLVRWIVQESSHFPSLEELELLGMSKLEEISLVFGELMTLVSIKMVRCSDSAVMSARQILEEQEQGGNNDLIVDVLHYTRTVELKEELLQGFLPNDNFHLNINI